MNMMPGSMMTGHMQAGQPGGHPMQAGQPVHSIIPGHSMQTGQSVVHSMQPGQAGHSMQHMQPQPLMQGGGHSMTPGMPVGHLMQPGHQGQQPQQPLQPHQPSSDIDSVTKFKLLIPQLKDALQKVMSDAAYLFSQNAQTDSCSKSTEVSKAIFDKNLEKFYALCDQIELNLRLSIEVLNQSVDCRRNVVLPVQEAQNSIVPTQQSDALSYSQYVNLVKMQISSAKEIHDILADCAKRIGERS